MYFWRIRGGVEVDLVLARGSRPVAAIEIKNTANPGPKHFAGLRSFLEEYPKAKTYLICNVPRSYLEGGVRVMGYAEFLKDIVAIIE